MKRIFITLTTALAIVFAMTSCVEQMPQINEELVLGRCLTPTEATAPIDRTDGKTVSFTWAESKGATQYTIEIFEGAEDADPATVFEGTPLYTETPEHSPLKKTLPSDKFYFARVKAQAPGTSVEDSKWKEFPYPIGTYEVKTNLWPTVVARTSESIKIQWNEIDADRVDHIRVSPDPEDETKAYKRYDVTASTGETVAFNVDGLAPSVKYTVAVHFKSANRGEVVAWTRPSLNNPTVVSTSEQLNNALKDGAPVINVAYSTTPYDLRVADDTGALKNVTIGVNAENPNIHIYGEATDAGAMPVLSGTLNFPHGLVDIRVESIKFDGNAYSFERPVVINGIPASEAAPVDYGKIEFVNCEVTGYKCGVFYYNSGTGTVNIGSVLLSNLYVTDTQGSGGDGIDVRAVTSIGRMEISECTFVDGFRDFLRIDANATVSAIKFSKNTLCNVSNTNANKGIFYVRAAFDTFEFSDNLIMHASNAEKSILACNYIPNKISNNWFYKLSPVFWMPEEIDDKKVNETGKGKLTQSAGLAGGGQILSSDPCYDSTDGNLYVKNAAVLEAKVGDPRWLQAYKEVAEDLTLSPVAAGKSWNLMDTKTFGKTVKKSMVRDGLRFIVGANPFKVSEKGLEFAAAGTVEALGVPSDAAVAFMINSPGTVILSSIKSNTGSAQGHITVAYGPADGSKAIAAGSVNIGMSKAKVSLPNVVPNEPQIVYLYGCSSVILTALQWTDQVDEGGSAVLAAPAVSISNESVQDTFTGEVKLSWDAVPAAGSYKVYVNLPADAEELPDAYAETSATEYVLPLSKLGTGKFTFQVQACPAADDMSREPSELSGALAFKYLETLKPVLVETVWGNDEFKYISDYWGEVGSSGIAEDFVLKNLGYLAGGGKLKTGTTNEKYRVQFNSSGSAGTKCNLQIMVGGPGKLVVTAVSSGDAEQPLAVAIGTTQVGEIQMFPDKTQAPVTKEFDLSEAKSGDIINLYRTGSGVNVLEIKWIPNNLPSVDPTWVSETTVWGDGYFANIKDVLYPGVAEIKEDFTSEKITYTAGGGKFKPGTTAGATRIQLGGSGSTTKQCFSFTVSGPGTLSITALSTGDDDRVLVVHDGTNELGTIAAPNKNADPVSNSLDVNSKSGDTLYIYSRSSGVNVLEIKWTIK